jgi:hypothetical protein
MKREKVLAPLFFDPFRRLGRPLSEADVAAKAQARDAVLLRCAGAGVIADPGFRDIIGTSGISSSLFSIT